MFTKILMALLIIFSGISTSQIKAVNQEIIQISDRENELKIKRRNDLLMENGINPLTFHYGTAGCKTYKTQGHSIYGMVHDFLFNYQSVVNTRKFRFSAYNLRHYKTYFDCNFYYQDGTPALKKTIERSEDGPTVMDINVPITIEEQQNCLFGLLTAKFTIRIPSLGVNKMFAYFEYYFPDTKQLLSPGETLRCPYMAIVYPDDKYCETYGESYTLSNYESVYEVEKYEHFAFNDINLTLIREYYNDDIYKHGQLYMTVFKSEKDYEAYKLGNKYESLFRYNEIEADRSDKFNQRVYNNILRNYDLESHKYVPRSGSNTFESYDIYFEKDKFFDYQEPLILIEFINFGYTNACFDVALKVKFLKFEPESTYEIIGEIDEEIEDEEMENIDL